MATPKHKRNYWKKMFNRFTYGMSCEYENGAEKMFWKYNQKGIIKQSKFRISIELGNKLVQGHLYYRNCTEEEAWMMWLKNNSKDTYLAVLYVQKEKFVPINELERKFPLLIPKIFTHFGNHKFLIDRHWLGSGKPIIYSNTTATKEELHNYIEKDLPKYLYGKKAQDVKEGYDIQNKVFEILKARMKAEHYQILVMEQDKFMSIDGHKIKFDIFGIVRTPAFNTPLFFVVEVKNYGLTFKHLSQVLLFDYKVKKAFGNTPIMKFVICKSMQPVEMFKRCYELGITIMTTYKRANNELVIYPKRRGIKIKT